MSNQQRTSEALRLADDLEASSLFPGNMRSCNNAAAAELRRQHAENTALQAGYNSARLEIESLKAQRAGAQQPGAAYAALPDECDSPEICAISKTCAGQFGTKRICASHVQAPAPVRGYPPLPDFDTVEQHIYGACRRYITQDMLEPIHNLIRDAIDADRAARAQADSVLEDAARYRFLAGHCRSTSEHWGGRWSIIIDGPAPKSHDSEDDFDAAIDAARAARAPADSVTAPAAYSGNIEQELAMLIRRIVSSARRNCEDGSNVLKLANEAWVYLVRKGLNGSPLRDAGIESDPTPAAQAADSVLEDAGGANWQDISTAPKDGTRFVAVGNNYGLYSEAQHTCIAQWFRGCWIEASDWNEASELKYLTHWMPLLPLPGSAEMRTQQTIEQQEIAQR